MQCSRKGAGYRRYALHVPRVAPRQNIELGFCQLPPSSFPWDATPPIHTESPHCQVLRTLDRVSKTITVLLSPTEVAFVANPNSPDSLQVWAVLAAVSECDVVPSLKGAPRDLFPSGSLCGSRVLRPPMLCADERGWRCCLSDLPH